MKEFAAAHKEELSLLAGTVERLFPSPDDRISAVAMMAWCCIVSTWKGQQRNALPLLKDRIREVLMAPMDPERKAAGVPARELLDQVGWTFSQGEEVSLLREMFAKEVRDGDAQTKTPHSPS